MLCQSEVRRVHIGKHASPMHLKHTQASPLSTFNALIVFHKPFNSQHLTFENTIFSLDWNSTKTLAGGKWGIVSTMILGIRYSVGLGPDESKNNLFLSPFFKNISSLKVQCDAELWSFHPNLLFCITLKEISRIQQKNE